MFPKDIVTVTQSSLDLSAMLYILFFPHQRVGGDEDYFLLGLLNSWLKTHLLKCNTAMVFFFPSCIDWAVYHMMRGKAQIYFSFFQSCWKKEKSLLPKPQHNVS